MTCWLLAALLVAGHPDDLNVRAEVALRAAVTAFAKQPVAGPVDTTAAGWAYLAAFEVTGEPAFRAHAVAAATALADTQLQSGGWSTDPRPANPAWTRRMAQAGEPQADRANRTDLTAQVTPEPLRFMARVATLCGDAGATAASEYGILSLLLMQRADGGWPAAWPPAGEAAGSALATPAIVRLLHATPWPQAHAAARRGGDWLLKTRAPDGWAGDAEVTADALLTLAALHGDGADRRWLTAARDVLSHRPPTTPALTAAAAAVSAAARGRLAPDDGRESRAWRTAQRTRDVAAILAAQGADGLWTEDGQARASTFAANVRLLADFVREYEPLPAEFTTDPERPGPHRR